MNDDVWIGIDLGTQSVRALAVDDSGVVLGTGTAALTSTRDAGRHEQDPAEWWSAVAHATRAALKEIAPQRIRAVAVDGTSGTVVLQDRHGVPLTPGIMYDDNRGASSLDAVNEAGAELWGRLGYGRMQASWALPKLVTLLRDVDVPGLRIRHQVDVINEHLVGRPVATDLSNALKTGADLITEKWPEAVMTALDVPVSALPTLVRSGALLGHVSTSAAEITGIPAGTAVIAGSTDGCAAQMGAGALSTGSWNSVLGTTLILKGVTEDLLHDPLGVVYSHRSPDGQWLPGGASSSGAGAIARAFGGADLAALEREIRSRGINPRAAAYPLVSQGERFPFRSADARPFTIGKLSDDADQFAALLLGLAYVERLSFDYLRSLGARIDGAWILTGGGTRNRTWNELRVQVSGRSASLPVSAEPALGMAVLAASHSGSLVDTAARMVRIREDVHLDDADRGRYDEGYSAFVDQLETRGWLPTQIAASTRTGATR